jgi:predicted P-loop ATPase
MKFLTVNPDRIPATMKALAHWHYWRGEPDKHGKFGKVPRMVGQNRRASSTDPDTWSSYDTALAGINGNGCSPYNGLGFAVQGSGVVFIDFDHCRNPQTSAITPWVSEIIAEVDSYAEISPSGNGLHAYALGKLPGKGITRKFPDGSAIEMYDAGRYATVTGHPIDGTPGDLRACDVQALYMRLKNGQVGPQKDKVGPAPELEPEPGMVSESEPADAKPGSVLDLLGKFGLIIVATEDPFQGETETGIRYVLSDCPFYPPHRDAAVFDFPSGPVFHCFHKSCAGNTWRHLCSKFEYQAPGALSWRHQIIVSESGKPKALLQNAVLMLRHAPEWQGVLGFNEFSLYAVTKRPAPWPQSVASRNWDDDDDTRTACWLQAQGVLVSSKVAAEAVQMIAREHPFHPVRDYLNAQVWDGKPRISDWLTTYLGVKASPLSAAIGNRWLISAVARIKKPGCKADFVLLLEGPQGIGKSSAAEVLASPPWFTDHLSDLGSKDSRIELHGKWIIELAEFVSRRSELERKAFLTACSDNFRAPYDRRAQWVPRSNVFCATSNDATPLTDETGGRRYWPVTCGGIDLARLRQDRDQLWAEANAAYESDEPWWDDFQEFRDALAEEQEARYQGGPHDDLILGWCEHPIQREQWENGVRTQLEPFDSNRERVTIADVLRHAIGKPQHTLTRSDQLSVVACLTHNGWRRSKQTKIHGTNRNVRHYIRPLERLGKKKLGEE